MGLCENPNIHRFLWSRLAKHLIRCFADNEPRPQGAVSPDLLHRRLTATAFEHIEKVSQPAAADFQTAPVAQQDLTTSAGHGENFGNCVQIHHRGAGHAEKMRRAQTLAQLDDGRLASAV
jgi:hypothetical protein